MITANELRVGNWVEEAPSWSKHKQNIQIESISDKGFNVSWEGEWDSFSDLNPIPLTAEILEMAGFEKEKHTGNFYYKKKLAIHQTQGVATEFIFNWPRVHGMIGTPSTAFNFVHELQNLVFSLTGEELEINLTAHPVV